MHASIIFSSLLDRKFWRRNLCLVPALSPSYYLTHGRHRIKIHSDHHGLREPRNLIEHHGLVFPVQKEFGSFSAMPLDQVLENVLLLRENTLECPSCQGSIHPMATGSPVLQRGRVSSLVSQDPCFVVASPQDPETSVSSHRDNLFPHRGPVHSCPTSKMLCNRPK